MASVGLRLVVKVGTGVVSGARGQLALGRIGALVEQIVDARAAGWQVLLVSSGAVGLGAARLGMEHPTELADRQAAAAVGQGALLALYDGLFRLSGCNVAQVLLTESDFHHRGHYLNLATALERLLQLGTVPILNENDVVSTRELALDGQIFGDNDRLAALLASSLGADLLLLLSDVDGVYTAPPTDPAAARIPVFDAAAEVTIGANSARGRGGMGSKIEAARIAARSGVRTVIASGLVADCVTRVLTGGVGTEFPAAASMNRRRRWIAFATAPSGGLHINEGAYQALSERGASLLAPGISRFDGPFAAGDVIELVHDGRIFARGVTSRASDQLGDRGVAVHRDDIVFLDAPDPGHPT